MMMMTDAAAGHADGQGAQNVPQQSMSDVTMGTTSMASSPAPVGSEHLALPCQHATVYSYAPACHKCIAQLHSLEPLLE